MVGCWNALRSSTDYEGTVRGIAAILERGASAPRFVVALKRASAVMASAASKTGREAACAKRGAFREQLARGGRGSGVAYRVLRAPANPPVTFVQDEEGHLCSETTGLDQCMRGAWGR
eukprot:6064093-Alexandrium_andersonii.AAC.1